MTTLTWEKHRGHAASYDVVERGYNYRLDEIRAAMGLHQLGRLPEENAQRRAIAAVYRERLADVDDITMPFGAIRDGTTSAQHLAVALVPAERRDDVRQALSERRIQTSVHYPPIHQFSYYRELGSRRPLPQTEAVAPRIITLPLFGHMTHEQVDLVVDTLSETLRVA